jgi:sugar phosphate isomerase/epimerase
MFGVPWLRRKEIVGHRPSIPEKRGECKMKAGVVICGPDVSHGPLALLSGTFEQRAAKASDLGYAGVEIMVRDPEELDWQEIEATLERFSLDVPQIVTGELFGQDGLCLATSDEEVYRRAEQRTRSVIDLAARLGTMVNIGRLRGQLSFLNSPDARTVACDRLRRVISYAADRGVRVTIEPLNRYETDFIFNARDGMEFLKDIGCENAGLMLDLFHMNIEEASIEGGLRLASERLWHVHVADSNRRYPGCGHLDFDTIFDTLSDIGYAGFISAEMLPWPDPDTAAKRALSFMQRYFTIG